MHFARIMVAVAFLTCWTQVAGAATTVVNVMSNFFSPSDVTVNVGDTVQRVWQQGSHTTTSADANGVPNGLWDSGIKSTGATFEFTFNQPGDFNFICTLHFSCCNMAGTVHVNQSVSPAAAQLVVSAPSSATAGSPFDVTVTAADSNGNVVPGYSGTVAFTSSDPYPAALPANYTFTATDQGVHTFSGGVTLFTAGSQTVTVQDTATSSITGSATVAVSAGPTAQFAVSAPLSAIAGSPFDVTITALDSDGNIMTGYTGTVAFTSTDPSPAVLPANYTFTSTDQGVHTFSGGVTLFMAESQTLTVQDTATSSITGSATVGVTAGPTPQFVVRVPISAVAGTPFDVTITALDSGGNIMTGYTGTVAFTSSDPSPAVLPANYTFTSTDQGVHTFSGGVTLFTAGSQTLTVQDPTNSLTGSATIGVVAAPASQFLVTAPATAVSGTPFDVALAALDPVWQRGHELRRHGRLDQQRYGPRSPLAGRLHVPTHG